MIEDGKFIPKWKYEMEVQGCKNMETAASVYQEKVMKYERTIRELHEEIDRISENHDEMEGKFLEGQLQNLSVTVNGERYKII